MQAKSLLNSKQLEYTELSVPDQADREMIQERVTEAGSAVQVKSVPQIFHGSTYVGTFNDLTEYLNTL